MKTVFTEVDSFKKTFLIFLVIAISLIFFFMVRGFLVTLLLAAIFSAMVSPVFKKLTALLRGKRKAASILTTVGVFFVIILPMLGLAGMLVAQAVEVSQAVRPWVESHVNQPNELDSLLQKIPFMDVLEPYKTPIIEKLGEFASRAGGFLVSKMAETTKGTAIFFFLLFIMLYSMYFFLLDGKSLLDKILYYMPLSSEEENRMVEKFVSVSRATLKGTLVIGIIQGTLAGIAFWVAGVNGALFWGTIMAVLSVIPGIGAALVWIPAVGYLIATGHVVAALLLTIWCAGLVGTVDNLLRPWLVGKDTKMPDLLILLSTLGGLVLFGAVGVILGPIVAALFITVWDIYGVTFKDL
ncbi:MAG: AI-2E family transporter, partial [Gemmatimonadota bacterium]|nr:AI-2E family transporter [Gemmatimonadota bacterium]